MTNEEKEKLLKILWDMYFNNPDTGGYNPYEEDENLLNKLDDYITKEVEDD